MTVPSERTLTKAKCPNCAGEEWDERVVDWMTGAPKEVKPEKYLDIRAAESDKMRPRYLMMDEYIQKVRQFILSCKRCGYTLVKSYEPPDAIKNE